MTLPHPSTLPGFKSHIDPKTRWVEPSMTWAMVRDIRDACYVHGVDIPTHVCVILNAISEQEASP